MINTSEYKNEDIVKSGITEYPIGFNFYFNIDKTPQLLVKIGDEELRFNYNFKLSEDQGSVVLRPTKEELLTLEGPEDFSWMSKWDGKDLLIERAIPLVQDSDYQLGRISSEQIERDFDLSVMRDQMLVGKNEELRKHTDNSLSEINDRIDEVVADHTMDVGALDNKITALNNSVYKKSEVYTKGETDSKLSNVYTKAETDTKLSNVYTKAETDSKLSSVYKVKGSVSTESALPTNPNVGDVYNVLDTGANYVWSSEGFWDKLGDIVDLSGYVTKEDLANIDLDGYVKKSGDTMTGDLAFDVVAGGYTVAFQDSYENANTGNTESVIKRIQSNHSTQGLIFSETKNGTVTMQFSMISDGFFMPRGNRLLGSVSYPWENVYAKKLNNGADLNVPTEGGTLARLEDLDALVPDQTDNAGKFLMTDGENISWGNAIKNEAEDPATDIEILTTTKTEYSNILIGGRKERESVKGAIAIGTYYGPHHAEAGNNAIVIGKASSAKADSSIALGFGARAWKNGSIAIGNWAEVNAEGAIQLNARYSTRVENNEAGTFKVCLGPYTGAGGNYKLLDIDGTIPTNRYATTPTDAGTYVPKLTIAEDGTATREWGAESGGGSDLPDQTDNAGKFLTTDGTTPSWSDKPLVNNTDHASSIGIGSKATRASAVVIGTNITTATNASVTIGANASTNTNASVAIGYYAGASQRGLALGSQMSASAENSIQIGCAGSRIGNTDPNTFKVYNGVDNYEMMDANGNIPLDRLTYVTDQIGDISTALTSILGE